MTVRWFWKSALFAMLLAGGLGLKIELQEGQRAVGSEWTASVAIATAEAQSGRRVARRTARRTSRRTSARMNYYQTLPARCVWRPPYHYCGGVYYEPVVQSGVTVYVIVTP